MSEPKTYDITGPLAGMADLLLEQPQIDLLRQALEVLEEAEPTLACDISGLNYQLQEVEATIRRQVEHYERTGKLSAEQGLGLRSQ